MPLRPKFTHATLLWAVAASLLLVGCSSSNLQDMNKGTDVGAGFVPPDTRPRDLSPDSQDVARDQAEAADQAGSSDKPEVADQAENTDAATYDGGSTDDGSDTPVNKDD
jgi:hypothetical protein